MTDPTALLQSILSDPADDHRRLLYADHLDECGEGKRAEFVRVQVELERPIGQSFVDVEEILELRRRERSILLYNPWPQWFVLPQSRGGYFLNGFGFETQNQQGIGITPRRGFISTIRLSWSDWLRHHEAMYWHPKQTRPFVATAQPITRVELTTWPCEPMTGINASAIGVREHTFNRVKCSECDGRGLVNAANGPIVEGDPIYQCPACRGQPLNEWHCDQWPTITFVMPDSR